MSIPDCCLTNISIVVGSNKAEQVGRSPDAKEVPGDAFRDGTGGLDGVDEDADPEFDFVGRRVQRRQQSDRLLPTAEGQQAALQRLSPDDGVPSIGRVERHRQHQALAADVPTTSGGAVSEQFLRLRAADRGVIEQVVFVDGPERERAHHRPGGSPPPNVDPRRFFSAGKTSERETVAPTRSPFCAGNDVGFDRVVVRGPDPPVRPTPDWIRRRSAECRTPP